MFVCLYKLFFLLWFARANESKAKSIYRGQATSTKLK